ncbi:hypothetical protein GSY71_11965 [Pusillimonas sp. TS35]|uniref:hypothetical protein n=1 Tax=Paracandidimonas lactea TaxID=2895524 RepID=UPI00136CDD7C|nr:hypothetical protein [Paracandidimonas lactea]MYN13853.1 hypothetical protein [Pusillimonas sp. TS35]
MMSSRTGNGLAQTDKMHTGRPLLHGRAPADAFAVALGCAKFPRERGLADAPVDAPIAHGDQPGGTRWARRATLALAVAVLAGCAGTSGGIQLSDVRAPSHYRGERVLPGNFAQIQQALFKHEAACGHAAKFVMDKRETNYATLIDQIDPNATTYERAIVVDIVQYQPNAIGGPRIKTKAYSYYSDAATLARIDQLFASMMKPGVCPGATPAKE